MKLRPKIHLSVNVIISFSDSVLLHAKQNEKSKVYGSATVSNSSSDKLGLCYKKGQLQTGNKLQMLQARQYRGLNQTTYTKNALVL